MCTGVVILLYDRANKKRFFPLNFLRRFNILLNNLNVNLYKYNSFLRNSSNRTMEESTAPTSATNAVDTTRPQSNAQRSNRYEPFII